MFNPPLTQIQKWRIQTLDSKRRSLWWLPYTGKDVSLKMSADSLGKPNSCSALPFTQGSWCDPGLTKNLLSLEQSLLATSIFVLIWKRKGICLLIIFFIIIKRGNLITTLIFNGSLYHSKTCYFLDIPLSYPVTTTYFPSGCVCNLSRTRRDTLAFCFPYRSTSSGSRLTSCVNLFMCLGFWAWAISRSLGTGVLRSSSSGVKFQELVC